MLSLVESPDSPTITTDATVYYDADETITDTVPAQLRIGTSFFSDSHGPAGPSEDAQGMVSTAPASSDRTRQHSAGSRRGRGSPSSPEHARRSRYQSGAPDVWAAAADANRLPSWASRSSRTASSVRPSDSDMTPRSAYSDLADISASSDGSTDDEPTPITPIYHGHFDSRARTVQDERDATLRMLECTDPSKSRRRPSELLLDELRSSPSPANFPSPSFGLTSPRPGPELPSLSSSLSTYPSSALASHGHPSPSSHLTSSPPPRRLTAATPSEDRYPYVPRSADRPVLGIGIGDVPSERGPDGSPMVLLGLREPSSPDSAHFTPPPEIMFSSPASSQFHLDFPGSYSGEFYRERVPTPPAGTQRRSDDSQELDSADDIRLERQAAPARSRRGSFLHKVRRIGSRFKNIFSTSEVPSRPRVERTTMGLVSPHTPSFLVNVQLPQDESSNTVLRERISEDRDTLQFPAFTLTDASQPALRPTRFATITALPQVPRRSRRFSLPLMFGRTRSVSDAEASCAQSTSLPYPTSEEIRDRDLRHAIFAPDDARAKPGEISLSSRHEAMGDTFGTEANTFSSHTPIVDQDHVVARALGEASLLQ